LRSASHGTCAKYNDFPILAGDPEAREHVGIGSVFFYTMLRPTTIINGESSGGGHDIP
jgi:hypothetical protein